MAGSAMHLQLIRLQVVAGQWCSVEQLTGPATASGTFPAVASHCRVRMNFDEGVGSHPENPLAALLAGTPDFKTEDLVEVSYIGVQCMMHDQRQWR